VAPSPTATGGHTLDRFFGNGWVLPLTALTAVVPLLALLALAYTAAREEVLRDLRSTAAIALRSSEHVLDQAVADLDPVMTLVGAECGAETVARLQHAVYDSGVTREVGLFRADLQVYCTNFGPADVYPEAAVRARFPPEGLFVAVFRTELMHERSVVVHRRTATGAGANAVVAPREFRNEVLGQALGVRAGLRLSLADGTLVGQTSAMGPVDAPGFLSAHLASERLPLRVDAMRPAADVTAGFHERLPRFGLVGLALGLAAASGIGKALRRRLSLEAELRTALRRGELEVHYQPVIELASGRCAGAEALVRWRHPRHGLLQPALFIAMAEETGLVMPMTSWMLTRVRDDVWAHFRKRPEFHVGVNLVAQHFQDERIVDEVRALLAGSGVAGSVFMFEATERQLIEDRDGVARRVMGHLRELGCTLAIDDFGTGQSSLAYLQRFHMDFLKVDKAFVDTIGTDSLSRPVLDAVIELGGRLGMRLIAEGVERPHQADYLRERGVHLAQGYLFSPPLPIDGLAAFVASANGGAATGG
jgi:sensor c-di-GMP phosphodiesterase-like protein